MTTLYSSLYDQAPNRGSTVFIPRSPFSEARGKVVQCYFTWKPATGTILALGDTVRLIPGAPAGTRVSRFLATGDGSNVIDAGSTLVVNLAWASQVNAAGGGGTQSITGTGATFSGVTFQANNATIPATVNNDFLQLVGINAVAAAAPPSATTNYQSAGAQDELLLYAKVASSSTGSAAGCTVSFFAELVVP